MSSFCSTCPYHRNLFCCSIYIISSIPSLSLNSLLGTLSFTLTVHIHLTILISARWSATPFSFLTGQERNTKKPKKLWHCWEKTGVMASIRSRVKSCKIAVSWRTYLQNTVWLVSVNVNCCLQPVDAVHLWVLSEVHQKLQHPSAPSCE